MGRRENNVMAFKDTVGYINHSEKLMKAITETRKLQKVILETDIVQEPGERQLKEGKIIVSGKRTLEAAQAYSGKKVCVLNFASATNPGGGVVHGSSAQEESICRCSTLYFCLNTEENMKSFYIPHRKNNDPLYNDDLIYSPQVLVMKSDTSTPERLPEKDWYQVDVITCAAPNLREHPSNMMNPDGGSHAAKISDDDLAVLLEKRLRRIVETAAIHQNEILILGAFGCGAFRNPPEIVAGAFHKVLEEYRKCFETIEFAVYHTASERNNYDAFQNEFSGIM